MKNDVSLGSKGVTRLTDRGAISAKVRLYYNVVSYWSSERGSWMILQSRLIHSIKIYG